MTLDQVRCCTAAKIYPSDTSSVVILTEENLFVLDMHNDGALHYPVGVLCVVVSMWPFAYEYSQHCDDVFACLHIKCSCVVHVGMGLFKSSVCIHVYGCEAVSSCVCVMPGVDVALSTQFAARGYLRRHSLT